jgi:hypothetical protein
MGISDEFIFLANQIKAQQKEERSRLRWSRSCG